MRIAFSRIFMVALLAASQLLTLSVLAADVAQDPDSIDVQSLTELNVELNDDEGNPTAGAAVMVYAMRMVEPQGHGYWNNQKLGPPKPILSDERGIAVVKYPAKVYASPNTMTTTLVTFNINHADFESKIVDFAVGPQTAEVSLKRGCEIQLSAIGDTVRCKVSKTNWFQPINSSPPTRAISLFCPS